MTTTQILGKMREVTSDPPRLVAVVKSQDRSNTEEITTFAQLQSFIEHYGESFADTIELTWNFLNGQDRLVVEFDYKHCRILESDLYVDQCNVKFVHCMVEQQKRIPLSIGNVVVNSDNLRQPEAIAIRYRYLSEAPITQPTA